MLLFLLVLSSLSWCVKGLGSTIPGDYLEKLLPVYSLPTTEEIARAIVIKPNNNKYGKHIRQEKQVRVAFVGGSQTSTYYYVDIFRLMFRPLHKEWSNDNKLIVVNDGVNGGFPGVRMFHFERLSQEQWPNIIVLEYAINCGSEQEVWSSVGDVDSMIDFIYHKYDTAGLQRPEFLFLEFFRIGLYYNSADDKDRQRGWRNYDLLKDDLTLLPPSQHNNLSAVCSRELEKPMNRGSYAGTLLLELARFRRIPFLSFKDALFPAFTRFYTSHHPYDKWPFSEDGSHASQAGCQYMVKHILLPFFQNLIEPTHQQQQQQQQQPTTQLEHSIKAHAKEEHVLKALHLFPIQYYAAAYVLGVWNIWSERDSALVRQAITPVPPLGTWGMHYLRGHNDHHHDCYGTTKTAEKGILRFAYITNAVIPSKSTLLLLKVGYLQSFNTSYIANATCDLFVHDESDGKKQLSSMSFQSGICNGVALTNSLPCENIISLPVSGNYTLKCQNDEEGKLACITSITLLSKQNIVLDT